MHLLRRLFSITIMLLWYFFIDWKILQSFPNWTFKKKYFIEIISVKQDDYDVNGSPHWQVNSYLVILNIYLTIDSYEAWGKIISSTIGLPLTKKSPQPGVSNLLWENIQIRISLSIHVLYDLSHALYFSKNYVCK